MLSLVKEHIHTGRKMKDGCAAGQSIWIALRDTNAYVLLAGFRAYEWQGLMALPDLRLPMHGTVADCKPHTRLPLRGQRRTGFSRSEKLTDFPFNFSTKKLQST